ncbi:MAG: leucyl/phenylalanyl-tRNA--protein transferase [Bacteroidetes bacterium]|nr:leucyl/phenylalanyl-tRNA--protein transferase [Bacteroidota bacterium]
MYVLDPKENSFPDPEFYHPTSGIVAVGGDLSVDRLLLAYENGIFPWYNPGEEILWWCPDPRFVLFPSELKVSKSMKKILRNQQFTFTENQCFRQVMEACMTVTRKEQESSWISNELIDSFEKLNLMGIAKSIEVWQNSELVGGFYGLVMGKVFCGESMFSKVSNASKAGFIQFVQKYQQEFSLIDCQSHTEHLESLGAQMIPKLEYLNILKNQ